MAKKDTFFLGTLCLGHVNLVTTCRKWDNLYKWGSECVFRLAHFITGLGIATLN